MGCGASKQTIKEIEPAVVADDKEQQPKRTKVENYPIDGGAVYSGEMLDGLRDGMGTQKCML